MSKAQTFVFDIWYFAGISSDLRAGKLVRRFIAGEPITLGRRRDGSVFALRDICPHRAAPLSAGELKDDTVECPYHGWRFSVTDGACKEVPAMCADQNFEKEKVKVRTYFVEEKGQLIWIYLPKDKRFSGPPPIAPPDFPFASTRPVIDHQVIFNNHIDQAVLGLIDPAHGPYVHRQWWWRSEKSMHEKAKKFEPREYGFAMAAHSPSSNSFAYKLLGGKPITEITFRLPGVRTEDIKVGAKTLLSFTIVTPIDEERTLIRQLFFTDMTLIKILAPILKRGVVKFLHQDGDIVDLQKLGLAHDPVMLLVDDADTQAKWYYAIKKEWTKSREEKRDFVNPVKPRTLRWRS